MPSFWSSVANSAWKTRRSKRRPSRRPVSRARSHALAGRHDRRAAVRGDRSRPPPGLRQDPVVRDHPGDQAGSVSASRASIVRPVRIRSIALAWPTSRVSRWVPPMPGITPSLISGWPKTADSPAMIEVAHHRQFAAAAQRVAGDRGDLRGAQSGELLPAGEVVLGHHVHGRLPGHLPDVGARREDPLRAGDDEAADLGVAVQRAQDVDEFGQQLGAERVAGRAGGAGVP